MFCKGYKIVRTETDSLFKESKFKEILNIQLIIINTIAVTVVA